MQPIAQPSTMTLKHLLLVMMLTFAKGDGLQGTAWFFNYGIYLEASDGYRMFANNTNMVDVKEGCRPNTSDHCQCMINEGSPPTFAMVGRNYGGPYNKQGLEYTWYEDNAT